MAEQSASIRSRIAALNIEQVHVPSPSARPDYTYAQPTITKNKPPPPPPGQRPSVPQRNQTINNPPVQSNAPTAVGRMGNQPAPTPVKPELPKRSPALPPRPPPRSNTTKPPGLPPRPPSEPLVPRLTKKGSSDTISTISSTISSFSLNSTTNGTSNGGRRNLPPVYDPTTLPPLITKKQPEDPKQSKAILTAMKSTEKRDVPKTLPPQLPSRPTLPTRPTLPARVPSYTMKDNGLNSTQKMPPPSTLSLGLNKSLENPPPIPAIRPSASPASNPSAPPPIPLSSRPNLNAIMASKPKPGAQGVCLICRDFSGPDSHAAQFPRTNLPSSDVGWLATQLTAPFPSLTDKARAIFVWLHHNVDYDCHSFFSGTVSHSTPERTLTSGLAVCSGYAGLFSALALKAGLECVVISGHGKGYGHSALKPGDPLPPFKCGHAWNAVRIDNGEWKLIDACWGAGNVSGRNYERCFKPSEFTKSNDEFGLRHFPEDRAHFYRSDGGIMTWEEYMMDDMGERLTIYGCGGAGGEHGIGARTFQPPMKHIKVHDPQEPVIRFQFAVPCPHWDHERHGKGKPYVLTLNVGGRDGRNSQHIPFNTDGKVWWLDLNRLELGAPGQKINVCAITDMDGRDARGLTAAQFKAKQGKVSTKWSYVCMWELI